MVSSNICRAKFESIFPDRPKGGCASDVVEVDCVSPVTTTNLPEIYGSDSLCLHSSCTNFVKNHWLKTYDSFLGRGSVQRLSQGSDRVVVFSSHLLLGRRKKVHKLTHCVLFADDSSSPSLSFCGKKKLSRFYFNGRFATIWPRFFHGSSKYVNAIKKC